MDVSHDAHTEHLVSPLREVWFRELSFVATLCGLPFGALAGRPPQTRWPWGEAVVTVTKRPRVATRGACGACIIQIGRTAHPNHLRDAFGKDVEIGAGIPAQTRDSTRNLLRRTTHQAQATALDHLGGRRPPRGTLVSKTSGEGSVQRSSGARNDMMLEGVAAVYISG